MSLIFSAFKPMNVMAIKTGQRMSLRRTLLLSMHTQYRHAHGHSEQPLFAHGKRPERCRKMHAQTGLATFETLWRTRQPGPAQSSMPYRRAYSTALPLETTRAQDRSALLQARSAVFTRLGKLDRGKGKWFNCLELLGASQDHSMSMACAGLDVLQLDVLQFEDEYRSSVDAGKGIAALRVQEAKQQLKNRQILSPLRTHVKFMETLSHVLRHCPYNKLQKSSWCFRACAIDLEDEVIELSMLHRCRQPSIWLRKYEALRLSSYLFRLHTRMGKDLTLAIFQEIDFPSGPGSERLQIDFKSFLGQYLPCAQYVSRGNNDHHAIMLRRSSATSKERLYTAVNHGFRSSQSSIKDIVKHSTRLFQRIPRRRVTSRWADALKTVCKLGEGLNSTSTLYESGYAPVFSLLLDFMTPEEIERRNESMGNYWFRFWQMQKQKDDREAHLETCQIKIRKARNEFRKKNKNTWEREGRGKRLDPANDVAQPSSQHQWRKQYGNRKPGKYRN